MPAEDEVEESTPIPAIMKKRDRFSVSNILQITPAYTSQPAEEPFLPLFAAKDLVQTNLTDFLGSTGGPFMDRQETKSTV
jgi:hypothetical protein